MNSYYQQDDAPTYSQECGSGRYSTNYRTTDPHDKVQSRPMETQDESCPEISHPLIRALHKSGTSIYGVLTSEINDGTDPYETLMMFNRHNCSDLTPYQTLDVLLRVDESYYDLICSLMNSFASDEENLEFFKKISTLKTETIRSILAKCEKIAYVVINPGVWMNITDPDMALRFVRKTDVNVMKTNICSYIKNQDVFLALCDAGHIDPFYIDYYTQSMPIHYQAISCIYGFMEEAKEGRIYPSKMVLEAYGFKKNAVYAFAVRYLRSLYFKYTSIEGFDTFYEDLRLAYREL